jgi:hypothetical protein
MTAVATMAGPIGAVNVDARDTDAKFDVNTRVIGIDGFVYRYVQASGAIAASQTDISVDSAGQATDGAGAFVGTTAFADNEYGWVRTATALAPDT